MQFEHRAAVVGAVIILSILIPILLAAFYDTDYGTGQARPVFLYRQLGHDCTFETYFPPYTGIIQCQVYP